ncbi:MAG: LVIVD repeat-containing protein, partial [Gammaproteobacteria bacterium]
VNDGKIAPVRSTSALVLSSTNANREKIYIQQPPVAASGYSSQAFNPHFPHTVRKTETKTCSDCHLSEENDNNAIMAQLLMFGTNFVNFVGLNAWIGTESDVSAVQVTEWEEPQAVIGSYLHRYAYPDWFSKHEKNDAVLQTAYTHKSGRAGCLQLRGEYLYVAEGKKGMRAYDVAGIANKGISQRVITAPFSPLGHDTRIKSADATCLALPTNQPIHPERNHGDLMRKDNLEQPFHPIYNYVVIVDSQEGLILSDVNTLSDGELRNNYLERALTWNDNGVLDGARHITLGGYYAYVVANDGLVILDLNNPLAPNVINVIPLDDGRATALQFRYLFVSDSEGVKVVDVTNPEAPLLLPDNVIALDDAQRIYVARTYAYVAAGSQGLAIIDVENPAEMALLQVFDGDGELTDSRDVIVATTNASLFAYVADGNAGLKVVQLTSPELQPNFYGFSPEPNPRLIARYATKSPALALSKGLDRDRGVDETGGQIAVFGRRGSRPFTLDEMRRLYLDEEGNPWFVSDESESSAQPTAADVASAAADARATHD